MLIKLSPFFLSGGCVMTAYLPSDLLTHDEKRKRTISNCMYQVLSHATAEKHAIVTWVECMCPLPIRKLKASGEKQAECRAGIQRNDSAVRSFHLTENKLGSFTYFHLLFPQALFLSNIRTHTVNQVCICCSISLTIFLPYEYMMASTHPTGAQPSCS